MALPEKSLIPHPEVQKLADDVALLREELTSLLTEADHLVQTVKPNLLALYQTKIGAWELRLLQAQCENARLKRKTELAQASLNQGRLPDWTAIEGQLELEFLQWQVKINEAAQRIKTAENRLKNLLAPADSHALKKLYYALVKKLHPDLNPALTDDQRRLWLRVQEAYEAGDLDELRALALLAEKYPDSQPLAPMETLQQQRKTLEKQIATMLERIEHIESQPPFTLEAQLEDDAWVDARRAEIDAQIKELQTAGKALAAHLETLMKRTDHGKTFGNN
jgi:DNA repair exonuclease SbcCD ATPase subunit